VLICTHQRARGKRRQCTVRAGHDVLDGGAVGQHGDQQIDAGHRGRRRGRDKRPVEG
jgi:hypothetical protein